MSGERVSRVEDFIRREISTIILHEINDERFKAFNITAVRCSSDLSSAKIYYKLSNQAPDKPIPEVAFKRLASLLRTKLAKSLTTRRVPRLILEEDKALDNFARISSLLDSVND
jgi:ribosome-binding factor A